MLEDICTCRNSEQRAWNVESRDQLQVALTEGSLCKATSSSCTARRERGKCNVVAIGLGRRQARRSVCRAGWWMAHTLLVLLWPTEGEQALLVEVDKEGVLGINRHLKQRQISRTLGSVVGDPWVWSMAALLDDVKSGSTCTVASRSLMAPCPFQSTSIFLVTREP